MSTGQSCRIIVLCTVALSLGSAFKSIQADDFTWEMGNSNNDWNNVLNWGGTPNEFPDDNTDSALVTVPSVQISPRLNATNITIGALTIRSDGDVNTGDGTSNFALTVQESLVHDGVTIIEDNGSSLTVWQSPVVNDFDTDVLTIDGGSLILRQDARVQVDGPLTVSNGGDIFGSGIVEMNSADAFINDGTIRSSFGGTLTVQRTGNSALIDLDGVLGNGALAADANSSLVIDLPLSDADFDGTMTIGSNAEIRINDAWTLDSSLGTQIEFNGGAGTATLRGVGATWEGVVQVNSGTAVLAAPISVASSASVTIADDTTIQFDAPVTFANPASIANGFATTWVVNDTVQVGMGAGNFNWDGLGQAGVLDGRTIVNAGGTLNIDVGTVDEPGVQERVSTRITMNSGDIDVRNADGQWEFDGILQMRNTANDVPVLSGDGGDEVLITGTVDVGGTGVSRIRARSIFGSDSSVQVAAGAALEIGGSQSGTNTVINGGSWTGAGSVNLDADLATVSSATTVQMPNGTFDIDGNYVGDTVALNAPLTLNVQSVDDNDGNQIDDQLQINGAAGQLNVQFTDPNQSYVVQGMLELNGPAGALVGVHLAGADVELQGATSVSGNSMSHAVVEFTGDMNVGANATFNLNSGSMNTPNIVRSGATFSGAGDLVVSAPGFLNVENGGIIGINVQNRGRFEPGLSTGLIDVGGDFTQTSTGVFGFEIAAAPGVDQDLLTVAGTALVDGELEVSAINGFVPTEGDVYTVIGAGTRLGTFDTLTTMTDSIFQFDAVALYSPNLVRIRITDVTMLGDFNDDLMLDCADVDALVAEIAGGGMTLTFDLTGDGMVDTDDLSEWLSIAGTFNVGGPYLPGDATLDGFVDGSDFGVWNGNKFTADNGWCGADFNADGVTDGSDFGIWNSHQFQSSAALASVPEPANWGMAMLAMAALIRLCSRRQA